jgi:hypothetical protein
MTGHQRSAAPRITVTLLFRLTATGTPVWCL